MNRNRKGIHVSDLSKGQTFSAHHAMYPIPPNRDFHSHDHYEIYFFIAGRMHFVVESHTFPLAYGDVVIIPPGQMHLAVYEDASATYERFYLYATHECLKQMGSAELDILAWIDDMMTSGKHCFHLEETVFRECLQLVDECVRSSEAETPIMRYINRSRMATIMGLLAQATELKQAQFLVPVATRIGILIDYINNHLTQTLTIDELAQQFYISKYHLLHIFKQQTKTSLYQYIQEKRIIQAKVLMQSGVAPGEVFRKCGFNDYAGFYKAFRKMTGMSPRLYIQSIR